MNYASSGADKHSEGPKIETLRKENELQVGLEDRIFSSGDDRERGRVTEESETLGRKEGVQLENIFVSSGDGFRLDQEAKEQYAAKETTRAVEKSPKGVEWMPSKDNIARSTQTSRSPLSTKDAKMKKVTEVGTSPDPPRPPRGSYSVDCRTPLASYLAR